MYIYNNNPLIIICTDNNEHADVVNKFQRQTNPRIPNETNELDKVVVGMLIRNTTLTLDCEPSLGHRRVCRRGGGVIEYLEISKLHHLFFYDNTQSKVSLDGVYIRVCDVIPKNPILTELRIKVSGNPKNNQILSYRHSQKEIFLLAIKIELLSLPEKIK